MVKWNVALMGPLAKGLALGCSAGLVGCAQLA